MDVEKTCISVVIPAHGRAACVEKLLETLALAGGRSRLPHEVIVVDSSKAEAAHLIESSCAERGFYYVRGPNNVSAKRNIGIGLAQHDVVLFIDSDCCADENILTAHQAAHGGNRLSATGGVIGITSLVGPDDKLWRIVELTPSLVAPFHFAEWLEEVPWGTCTNISFRKEVIREVGGFDEGFPVQVYGEDVDLGLRVTRAGYRIVSCRDALVSHPRPVSYRRALGTIFKCGRADIYLQRRFPDLAFADFPSFLLFTFVALVLALAKMPDLGIVPLLLTAVLFVLFVPGIIRALVAGQPYFKQSMALACSQLLDLAFEAGKLTQSMLSGRPWMFFKRFQYVEEQFIAEREKDLIRSWTIIAGSLAFIFALVVVQIAMGGWS